MKTAFGYMMASKTRRVYAGMTTDLQKRIWQHRVHWFPEAFTSRYNVTTLVCVVGLPDPMEAIAWEKRIKKWSHAKKVTLIEERNPRWNDLAWDWYEDIEQQKIEIAEARRTGYWPDSASVDPVWLASAQGVS